MSATSRKAKEIFVAAIKLAPDQWDSHLAEACAGDDELRRRVRDLLHANAAAGSFLESPASGPVATVDEPIREGPGTIIGPYKLLEQIGEGGFGLVFMAEQQQPVRRKVAVKILKPGMDTRQVIARFEAERQALALMDHPNIAKVLDAGAIGAEPDALARGSAATLAHASGSEGRPYFAMELVRGVPITDYCDQNRLTTRERLELFAHVCLAVQHAHHKGIIHRDIKPSNVMVTLHDDVPVVKVIDFGIAKALGQQLTDKTLVTGFAQMIGTPLYMSPEQAQLSGLDIDTRSDIYSLGVLLYELLTGTTPFDTERLRAAGYDEMRRIIREEEPPRPSNRLSTLGPAAATVSERRRSDPKRLRLLLRGELDWIVMKALEKDRNRRYETASAFAADVQRYLQDEAVLACPPSAWYRTRKFARRHKAGLQIAAAGALVLLLAGAGVSWALWDQAERTAEFKRLEENQTQEKREQAYQESLRQADAAAQRNYRAKEMTAALDRTETLHNDLLQQLGDPVKVHVLLSDIDSWDRKVKTARAAWQQAETLAGTSKEPLADALLTRLRGLDQLLKADANDYALARKLDSIRLAPAIVDGKPNPKTRGYAKVFADAGYDLRPGEEAAVAAQMLKSALWQALVVNLDYWSARETETDPKLVPVLLQVARKVDPDLWRDQVRDAFARGDTKHLQELAEKAKLAEQPPHIILLLAWNLPEKSAAKLIRRALVHHPGDFFLHFYLGTLLTDPAEQAGCFRTALAVRQTSSLTYYNLGFALYAQKDLTGAVDAFNKAIEFNPQFARAYTNLGLALFDQNDLPGAVAAYKEAIKIDSQFAIAHNNLGNALKAQKNLRGAVDAYNEAIKINPQYAKAYLNLGLALYDQQDFAGAVKAYDTAIEIYNKAIENKPQIAEAYYNLGGARLALYDLPKALDAFNKAIEINPQYADAHFGLGLLWTAKKDLPAAVLAYEEAIKINPQYATAYNNVGTVRYAQKNLPAAVKAYEAAIKLNPQYADAYNNRGVALRAQGDLRGAMADHKKAIELNREFAGAYFNLGLLALYSQGDLPVAVDAFKNAIRINPKDAQAHGALGDAFMAQGQFAEAKEATAKSLELLPPGHPNRGPAAAQLRQCQDLAALDARLPAVLRKEDKPKDATETARFAWLCQKPYKQLVVAAARFYVDAFAADAKLADDLQAGHRYNAACCAALAAAGQGTDADKLDDHERSRLRQQALAWLRTDLEQWSKRLEGGKPEDRALAQQKMRWWQKDTDLIGVRDADALKKLSAEEQEAWRKLWADVADLLKKADNAK